MSSEEHRKKVSELNKGKKWWNNGVVEKFQREKPHGDEWVRGKLTNRYPIFQDHKGEKSPVFGRKWWNNGLVNKLQKEKPEGDDWVSGKVKKEKIH